jgi:RNA recognition motif-containing protein
LDKAKENTVHKSKMAPEAGEGCRLFVYGVAEGTPNLELQAEFERFGLVTDTYNTGKGYAFVTFDNSEDARTATEELNGATVCGQQIKVGGNLVVCFYRSLTK